MKTGTPEIVLVTGASSGIGRVLAKCFAAEGARLILVARKRDTLQQVAEELKQAYNTQSEVIPTDLAEPVAPARLVEHLQVHGTKVDVLVNNAGFGARQRFVDVSAERQLQMLQVNVTALTHLTRLLLPGMIQRRRGGVLNVASTAGFQPGPGMAVYYASKAYVLSFSEALAEEARGSGVTVTALCPGPTETNFAASAGGTFSRWFKWNAMQAEVVAQAGHRAFRAGKAIAIPGLSNRLLAFAVRLAPRALARKVAGYFNAVAYERS